MLTLPFTVFITATLSLIAMWWAQHMTGSVLLLNGFLGLVPSFNDGIAFGINIPSPWQERLIVVALIAIIILAYKDRNSFSKQVGYGMIIGGAIANLVDRIIDGVVTDVFLVGAFPVFNLADAAISVGVAILILEIIFDE